MTRTVCSLRQITFCQPDAIIGRHGQYAVEPGGVGCPGHSLPGCLLSAVVEVRDMGSDPQVRRPACATHVDQVADGLTHPFIEPLPTGRLDPMPDIIAAHLTAHPHGTSGARYCPLCRHYASRWPRHYVEIARTRSLERRAKANR